MKYLSVCSGIEAATVAWHPLGWQPVAFGEIEKFPCQVLEHHYPDTPNWGDMTKFKEWLDADVNVFVGGTPCQSFSVAGLRKGLDDPRGNLMLTYLAIAARYRPQWLVWENVPGVLSSNGGLDFASLLRGMGELGYGFAYRILDAQYFGVAQRRRRVFVVGYLGNWRPAAAVLFERHSLQGHPAPSRKARERVADTLTVGANQCSGFQGDFVEQKMIPAMHSELCPSLKARDAKGPSSDGDGDGAILVPMVQPIATHDVAGTMLSRNTSGGFSNSIDHAAAGYMALQPIALAENTIGRKPENGGNGDGFTEEGPMYTLNATGVHGVAQPIAFAQNQRDEVRIMAQAGALAAEPGMKQQTYIAQPIAFSGQMSNPQTDVEMTQTLQAKNPMAVAFGGDIARTLQARHDSSPCADRGMDVVAVAVGAFKPGQSASAHSIGYEQEMAPTLEAGEGGNNKPAVHVGMAVRRLTPVECERLQGFPDNYTDIQPKGKATPDGPRYKALGNSMAVPVMAWIGKRIQEVDAICQTQKQ